MKTPILVLIFPVLALVGTGPATTRAGPADRQWEAEIAERLDGDQRTGEVIWAGTGNDRFLTLFTGPQAGLAQGVAIILHGLGQHPDWPEVIAPLRTTLPKYGWSTLSIQLPVLAPETPVVEYGNTLTEAEQRTGAAVRLLEERGFSRIVIIGHSFGAAIGAKYLAAARDSKIRGFVSIGIQAQEFLTPTLNMPLLIEKIQTPVLDIFGSLDSEAITTTVVDRRLAAWKGGNKAYEQVEVKGADHDFIGFEPLLLRHISSWIDKTMNAAASLTRGEDEHPDQAGPGP